MFQDKLSKYSDKGFFKFKHTQFLKDVCNAPTKNSGIYLIYHKNDLIYIGSSGQRNRNGKLKTRISGLGGMKDRIVNGYHPKFGKIQRKKVFPEIMRKEKIDELIIFWYVTYDYKENFDFPTDVEKELCLIYKKKYGALPKWHK